MSAFWFASEMANLHLLSFISMPNCDLSSRLIRRGSPKLNFIARNFGSSTRLGKTQNYNRCHWMNKTEILYQLQKGVTQWKVVCWTVWLCDEQIIVKAKKWIKKTFPISFFIHLRQLGWLAVDRHLSMIKNSNEFEINAWNIYEFSQTVNRPAVSGRMF